MEYQTMKSETEVRALLDSIKQSLVELKDSKFQQTQFTLHVKQEILEWLLDE